MQGDGRIGQPPLVGAHCCCIALAPAVAMRVRTVVCITVSIKHAFTQ